MEAVACRSKISAIGVVGFSADNASILVTASASHPAVPHGAIDGHVDEKGPLNLCRCAVPGNGSSAGCRSPIPWFSGVFGAPSIHDLGARLRPAHPRHRRGVGGYARDPVGGSEKKTKDDLSLSSLREQFGLWIDLWL